MNSLTAAICGVFALTLLTNCSKPNLPDPYKPSADIRSSFGISDATASAASVTNSLTAKESSSQVMTNEAPAPLQKGSGVKLLIFKSALEKEFLWQPSLIEQLEVPRFNGVKSRVVYFHQSDKILLMIESSYGHSATAEASPTLVLASFPITSETETSIEFDFNAGMSQVYNISDWRSSDAHGREYQQEVEFLALPLSNSFIVKAEMTAQNQLLVVQSAQVQLKVPYNLNRPIQTLHYFSPYLPNENFKPLASVNFERMGFFESAPLLTDKSMRHVYASRFDPDRSKPIIYAISSNTPSEMKAAVREGILYWNKAFGYEKMKVIDAPAGVRAPDPRYNIVQWVDWEDTLGAYADAQMDPRTGEILHSQIFLTSVFPYIGKLRSRMLLRQIGLKEAQPSKRATPDLTLAGLESSRLCAFDSAGALAPEASIDALMANLPEDRILEITRDYVRHVVAHEVGHTLGLRHNFAGNLGSNVDINYLDAISAEYLKSGNVYSGLQFSSSLMEYQSFIGAAMTGRLILDENAPAPSYDKKAIDVLYNNIELNPQDTPLYCTDTSVGKFVGCAAGDQGPSPIADAAYSERKFIENSPRTLMEKFIYAKTAPFGIPSQKMDEVVLKAQAEAKNILAPRAVVLSLLTDATKDLRVYRSMPKADDTNKDEVLLNTFTATATEVSRLGGLKSLLPQPSPSLAANWIETFNAMADSPLYRTGIGYNSKPYELTAEDITLAKAAAAAYFKKVQDALADEDIALLTAQTGAMTDTPLTDDFAELVVNRMTEYLTAESGNMIQERVTLSDNKTAMLVLPVFKYKFETRLAAAKILTGRKSLSMAWGQAQRQSVKNMFNSKIKSLLMDTELMSIRPEKNSRTISKWLIENKAITMALGAPEFNGRD